MEEKETCPHEYVSTGLQHPTYPPRNEYECIKCGKKKFVTMYNKRKTYTDKELEDAHQRAEKDFQENR